MTTISQTAGRSLRPSSSGGFFSTLANVAHALFDRLERRSAVKTLNELDDHALRDIGITRAGPGCLDSAPLDLSGFLPGYAERGALRFCRCVGRA